MSLLNWVRSPNGLWGTIGVLFSTAWLLLLALISVLVSSIFHNGKLFLQGGARSEVLAIGTDLSYTLLNGAEGVAESVVLIPAYIGKTTWLLTTENVIVTPTTYFDLTNLVGTQFFWLVGMQLLFLIYFLFQRSKDTEEMKFMSRWAKVPWVLSNILTILVVTVYVSPIL